MEKQTFLRSRSLILYLVTLLIMSFLPVAMAGELNKPFKWADDDDYRPFIYKDSNGKPAGFYKELMVELFNRMNIPLEYDVFPWKRAQKYAAEGVVDGMITTLTKERSLLFLATDPVFINSERVFARSDNLRIEEILAVKSVDELKSFKVVETIGSGWAEEHFKGLDVIWAPTYTVALNLLANGRADVYVLGKYPGMADIIDRIDSHSPYSDGLKKIVVGKNALVTINYCLLIRKDSEQVKIIAEFNKTLRQVKEDGTYSRLFDRYFSRSNDGQVRDVQ